MSDPRVTPIRSKAIPQPPKLSLLDDPDETVHRVACMLKYLAAHPRDKNLHDDPDEDFAVFLILNDLADALNWARDVAVAREAAALSARKEVNHV